MSHVPVSPGTAHVRAPPCTSSSVAAAISRSLATHMRQGGLCPLSDVSGLAVEWQCSKVGVPEHERLARLLHHDAQLRPASQPQAQEYDLHGGGWGEGEGGEGGGGAATETMRRKQLYVPKKHRRAAKFCTMRFAMRTLPAARETNKDGHREHSRQAMGMHSLAAAQARLLVFPNGIHHCRRWIDRLAATSPCEKAARRPSQDHAVCPQPADGPMHPTSEPA